ncbi:hypothetical protein [Zavarzinia sp. CC-PAN008]|uniref:hypothetical protein n=1 Tax=Zavarzinia sp. CC-PAN008 TaxID=3243332 RepID=UPI003F744923
MNPIHPDVLPQLETLALTTGRPLIISDADEVLFRFAEGFEQFLAANDYEIDFSTPRLAGNIRDLNTNQIIQGEGTKRLLDAFFRERTAHLDPVDGAADALSGLSARAQVVVLSNCPLGSRDDRIAALERHGMPYPVIANVGTKGPAVRHMADRVQAPVFFLDDIPSNHHSVKLLAEESIRMHFVADPRLARMITPSEDAHVRTDDWPAARAYIEERLTALGY